MSEKLLVPRIRFKEFTNAWEQWKIGDLLTERLEFSKQTIDFPLMAFIANEGITPKGERYDRSSLVKDVENKIYKVTKYGDFIYSSNNLDRGSIGANKYGNACISPVYSVFRPTNLSDSRFIEKVLCRNDLIDKILRYRQGVVYGQLRIHESAFLNINLNSPLLPEQHKIGRLLSNLDSLIALHQRKLSSLKNLKNRLLDKMFCDEKSQFPSIRFKGFTNAWEQEKLGNLGVFKSSSVDKLIRSNEHTIYLINYMDVYKKLIITSKNKSSLMKVTASKKQINECSILKNDVLFTPTSETADDIAHSKVMEETLDNTLFSYHLMRYRPYKNTFYGLFPDYLFDTDYFKKQASLLAKGVQRFVLGKPEFESLKITFPNVNEQEKISNLFRNLDSLIALHQRKLNSLKNIKNTLLEKMFV
ncbi:restriction endonuclease subunit S [Mycoplasmopsis agalactiae]|nr:restriction endonuclease subunit S [Mycoplasmopsis agalactiae]MCE6056565.1 restriction endonuclease subunit S [Mycoplasmopsis agalactiae]